MPGAERRQRAWLPRGLRARLTLWVAAVLLVCGGIGSAVVYRSTGARLRAQIEGELSRQQAQLARSISRIPDPSPDRVALATARYVHALGYSPRSLLLFALVPGHAPVSNHPELFDHSRADPGETVLDQARENQQVAHLETARLGFSTLKVPDVGDVRVLERAQLVGAVRVLAAAGEPLVLVSEAQRGVARAMLLAGGVLLALALIASYLAGSLVSAPLRRMAAVAARIDAGELAPRMHSTGKEGTEVQVLAVTFNHMLERLQAAFGAQREFLADASHELRTPLTVMRGQLEVLAAQESPDPGEVHRVGSILQEQVSRITRLVEDLLLLARSEGSDFVRLQRFELREYLERLWEGLSATAQRRFELGPIPAGHLLADPDRVAQALSNLVRNAIQHTGPDGLVRLETQALSGGQVRFWIIDDGPGIPPGEQELVFERLYRTDSSRSRAGGGAGLGLSIVRAIAEAHAGRARMTVAAGSVGTCAELVLPGFQSAEVPPALEVPAATLGPR